MSDYVVIADTGDILKKRLWSDIKIDPAIYPAIIDSEDDITLSSPQDANDTGKLSLFLYRMNENGYLKNREMEKINATTLKYPPVVMDLFYMITASADERKKDHILLGKVIQIFNDNAIIRGSDLTGCLEGTTEELKVTMHTLPFDQMVQLWQSFTDKSFKLSLCYQVTPVRIDSARETGSMRVVKS
ncbi:MAG: DUF4255 domain-containing protein [bacterium]|nr:DUF4255 domain-containing protein [bacterium]